MASWSPRWFRARLWPAWLTSRLTAAGERADDVGVARIGDREAADPVVPTAGGPELVVVALEVVHTGLREHGVVLDLALPECRAVAGDEHELRLALAQGLKGGLVAELVLAALHHKLQPRVDGVRVLGRLRSLLRRH